MAGKHDVWVYKSGLKDKVRPAVAFGVAGGRFRFRNLTGHTIEVTFPNGPMTKASDHIEDGKSKTFHVDKKADGVYKYFVKGGRAKRRAVGESDPEIIIDP